jgi:protein SCO1
VRSTVSLAVALAVAAFLSGGCGSSSATKIEGPTTTSKSTFGFAGAALQPPRQAQPIALHDADGHAVTLAAQRGRYVLVTFLYTHCPDVCPLIASNLRVAQNIMGPKLASKAQIIAVSVDPQGDTRKAVAGFLARHEMTGRMQYLVGSAHELARVWKAWGVGSEKDAQKPEFIDHSGLIYGITASGKRTTLYSPSFKPADIAHDVPLLAAR